MTDMDRKQPVKKTKKPERRRPPARGYLKLIKWVAVLGGLALIAYGASQMSGVAYNEDAIKVVDFSALNAAEKRSALQSANNARCSCGCGLGLAQCVATDSTCPIREANIERIRTMAREAKRP
jgi:hypothetical protein